MGPGFLATSLTGKTSYLDKDQIEQPPQVLPAQPFAVGDVVTLQSGGAPLTVVECEDGKLLTICVSLDGKPERIWLPFACFKAAE